VGQTTPPIEAEAAENETPSAQVMSIAAVLFDLGGVILRTEHQAPREHLAERLNMTYEDLDRIVFASESARLASVGAIPTVKHWEAVLGRVGRPASEMETFRAEFFAGDVLDRDLIQFIRELRPRRKTGLLSNGWPDLREYVAQNHVDEAFDVVIISAEVRLLKPDAAIYQLALQKLNVGSSETAFVDDTPANVEAANELGIHGILFENPAQMRRELAALLD
jgi:epoxide hydrolase-like predicted phosphatase